MWGVAKDSILGRRFPGLSRAAGIRPAPPVRRPGPKGRAPAGACLFACRYPAENRMQRVVRRGGPRGRPRGQLRGGNSKRAIPWVVPRGLSEGRSGGGVPTEVPVFGRCPMLADDPAGRLSQGGPRDGKGGFVRMTCWLPEHADMVRIPQVGLKMLKIRR
jgi:hypothetical protein